MSHNANGTMKTSEAYKIAAANKIAEGIKNANKKLRSDSVSLEKQKTKFEVNEVVEKLFIRIDKDLDWKEVDDYEEFIKRYPKGTTLVIEHVTHKFGQVTL